MSSETEIRTAVKKHQSEAAPHGHANHGKFSRTYQSWRSMRSRVFARSGTHHGRNYADRGITICAEWDVFTTFLADMGERPEGTSLERIDNDKGYSKDNCRWATKRDQCRNTSKNIIVEVNGVMMCLKDAAKVAGIKYETLYVRFKSGWSVERALSTPAVIGANQFSE
jgi:hypothetical protein